VNGCNCCLSPDAAMFYIAVVWVQSSKLCHSGQDDENCFALLCVPMRCCIKVLRSSRLRRQQASVLPGAEISLHKLAVRAVRSFQIDGNLTVSLVLSS
jgi:hypothetical protein